MYLSILGSIDLIAQQLYADSLCPMSRCMLQVTVTSIGPSTLSHINAVKLRPLRGHGYGHCPMPRMPYGFKYQALQSSCSLQQLSWIVTPTVLSYQLTVFVSL